MEYLVLSEVSRKQDYIFKSNKLAENVGASLIIKYVTELLPSKLLNKFDGEEVFEGGGKSLYLFKKKESSKGFIKELSLQIIKEFPGVEIFMIIQEVDMEKDDIIQRIDDAYIKLAFKKSMRKNSIRQISFGIEKICRSTGVCATSYSKEDMPISSEIKSKLNFAERQEKSFNELLPEGYVYSKEFDDLFKGKNKSYIAVVHIDGNKMGDKFTKLKEIYGLKKNEDLTCHNKNYLQKLKEFSQDIKKHYRDAFIDLFTEIVNKSNVLEEDTKLEEKVMPIRPLIMAGDDICFVCNGKIGVECARIFIESLNKRSLIIDKDIQVKLNACAGVAIVKSHYPFSRAYTLAEELCENGKKTLIDKNNGEDYSLIDWHIVQGEISGSINKIRDSYYNTGNLSFTMKPLYINNNKEWKNYENFLQALENISKKDISRNKVKTLREIFRQGKDKSEMYIKVNQLEKNILPLHGTMGDNGFAEDNTNMYFDALEVIDLFIKL